MKKLLFIAAFSLSGVGAFSQTCTITGVGTTNWSGSGNTIACAEGGNAVGKTTLIIPFGRTIVFDTNTDTWSGTTIEVSGTLRVTANPVLYTNIRVKSGGLLDLVGKLSLGNTDPACNYSLIVDAGGTVAVGATAADRLDICGKTIMKGGGIGACNNCGNTYSGQCPYNGDPYCQPPGGFVGPSAYDPSGYNPSLPIELAYFNTNAVDEGVSVTWATTIEENFLKFAIQRSSDGITFESIGEVAGQGFNIYEIESKYSFLDEAPLLGINYYRLKAVDLDESFEYFEVKAVRIDAPKKLAAYPNPSSGEMIGFRLNFNPEESDRIFLIDQVGVQVFTAKATETENTIVFTKPLQPGIYTLRYVSRDFEQVTRVVVSH